MIKSYHLVNFFKEKVDIISREVILDYLNRWISEEDTITTKLMTLIEQKIHNKTFKEVIFKYAINPNLSSSQYIVEYKNKFYYFDNYFDTKPKVFDDISLAIEEWNKNYEALKG